MNVCENNISKTGNQNKNCAGVKSVTAYCSIGAEVVFRRQMFHSHTINLKIKIIEKLL